MKKIILILGICSFSILQAEYVFKFSKNIEFSKENNEYSGKNVIVFRHINKSSEGWGDLVIGKVNNSVYIGSEADYRNMALSLNYDTYYTKETSWRCQNQDYIYPEVPKVDLSCSTDFSTTLSNYILYYKPTNITNIEPYYIKMFDREYGLYGTGTWIQQHGRTGAQLIVGESTLLDAYAGGATLGTATPTIPANSWVMMSN